MRNLNSLWQIKIVFLSVNTDQIFVHTCKWDVCYSSFITHRLTVKLNIRIKLLRHIFTFIVAIDKTTKQVCYQQSSSLITTVWTSVSRFHSFMLKSEHIQMHSVMRWILIKFTFKQWKNIWRHSRKFRNRLWLFFN